MKQTLVRITRDRTKRFSCSAHVPKEYEEWAGKEVKVYLPPATSAPPEITPCQSKFYWQVVTDDPGRWWVCEHAIDLFLHRLSEEQW
jgi:hypothetical protein